MRIENLSAGYHRKIIVHGVSLEVKKGEIISLIGPNGGGKSTLLKTIMGERQSLSGAVYIGEDDIRSISLKELSTRLSIVNTDRVKPEHMSAMDVVMSGRLPYSDGFGLFSEKDRSAGREAADLMKLDKFKDKPFMDLSDGQKQRTLIARAICQEPEYLVMDEPTSYLDIRYRLELMDVIRGLSGKGVTVIMSLHELELALMISDRVLMINYEGEVSCNRPAEVLESGVLQGLYGMTDEMYLSVKRQLEAGSAENGAAQARDMGQADGQTRMAQQDAVQMVSESQENTKAQDSACGRKHCSYFLNKECEYYPCHDLAEDKFSCLFCYCPLYDMEDCGETYFISEKGVKNCKDCTFPHDRDNYGLVIKKLKEKMYGKTDGRNV